MTQREKQLKVFGYGLPLILTVIGLRHGFKFGWHPLSFVLFALAAVVLLITLTNRAMLIQLFDGWMKVMGFVGSIVTAVILTTVYYLVFTPVAMFLRLRGIDYMNRRWTKQDSYWMARKNVNDDQQYLKQF